MLMDEGEKGVSAEGDKAWSALNASCSDVISLMVWAAFVGVGAMFDICRVLELRSCNYGIL